MKSPQFARGLAVSALPLALAWLVGCGGGAPSTVTGAGAGARVFADAGCGACHALAAAGATGETASDLDEREPSTETAVRWVRDGGKGMPSFAQQLDPLEIRQVARFVARS